MFTIWLLLSLAAAALAVWRTAALLAQYPGPTATEPAVDDEAFHAGAARALPLTVAGAAGLLWLGSREQGLGWRAAVACVLGALAAAGVARLAWHCEGRLRARTALRPALGGIVAGFGLGSVALLLLLFGVRSGATALGCGLGTALVALFVRRDALALLAADLLSSHAGALLAAVLVGTAVAAVDDDGQLTRLTLYPLLVAATGIAACAGAAALVQRGWLRVGVRRAERFSAAVMLLAAMALLTWWLGPQPLPLGGNEPVGAFQVYATLLIGVLLGPLLGRVAEQAASPQMAPAQELAQHSEAGVDASLLHGFATGMTSTWLPMLVLAIAAWASIELAGLYGICIAAVGSCALLATSPAWAPREPDVAAADRRARASVAGVLTTLAWYAVFAVRSRGGRDDSVTGTLLGVMLPFLLTGLLLRAWQAPPAATLRRMLATGALALAAPIATGLVFGSDALGSLLLAALATGCALSLWLRNTAGGFAGAVDYIDGGHVGGRDGEARRAVDAGDRLGQGIADLPLHIVVLLLVIAAVLALPLLHQ